MRPQSYPLTNQPAKRILFDVKSVAIRYKSLAWLAVFCMGAFLFYCSDDVSGPGQSGPQIDTIYSSPDSVLPGAKTVLSALVSEPDGDSLIYRWSTYPAAAKFSDTTSPVCTMTVAQVLEGGMFLKVTLRVSDGKNETTRDRWIALIEGETVTGNVYYRGTNLPIPFVEVSIGGLVDTNKFGDGSYTVRHVPVGEHTIQARLLACENCCDDYSANIISSGVDTVNHTVYMNCDSYLYHVHGIVKGSVLDGDTIKLENIKVTLINEDGTETTLTDTTDQDGQFDISGVPGGFRGFAIEDVGNPIYEVYPTIGWFVIPRADNRDAVISAKTKRTYIISDGITDTTAWVLEDDYLLHRWYVDTVNECYYFNTCDYGPFGKMAMANRIPIPPKAQEITVTADLDLEDARMYIGYIRDSAEITQVQFFSGTANREFEFDVSSAGINLQRHDFGVALYIENHNTDTCATACLKYLKISYKLPTY